MRAEKLTQAELYVMNKKGASATRQIVRYQISMLSPFLHVPNSRVAASPRALYGQRVIITHRGRTVSGLLVLPS